MTNEEAIEILTEIYKEMGLLFQCDRKGEAIALAIIALKGENK